jgi:hypothetical protein
MFMTAVVVLWGPDAYAGGYSTIGSAWKVNTYEHLMSFQVPSSDPKNYTVLFISETAWVDNVGVCRNNGGQITFVPGGGQSDPLATIRPVPVEVTVLPDVCTKSGGSNACTETATYYSKLSEISALNPSDFPPACTALGLTDPSECFHAYLGLPLNFQCQNQNGILIQAITREVCARVTAKKCGSKGCSEEATDFYRFTFPSFIQPEGALFTAVQDATCEAELTP